MKRNSCEETYLTPLTKDMKCSVNMELDRKIEELNGCDNTPYVEMYKVLYGLTRNLINALPDGYPVPVTRRR